MKKKVEVKPELDEKEVDFFIERLANILLMQVEDMQAEKDKKEEATKQAR
jgi:hypothetical protein